MLFLAGFCLNLESFSLEGKTQLLWKAQKLLQNYVKYAADRYSSAARPSSPQPDQYVLPSSDLWRPLTSRTGPYPARSRVDGDRDFTMSGAPPTT